MARKSTSRPAHPDAEGVIERMEFSMAIPPTASESRPGAAVSLEMVNVFGEPVADGARLRLTAWVNNVAYVKHVWVDAYLTDAKGAVVSNDTLLLDYYEGAGGGGDFFILDAAIPAKSTGKTAANLQYRLYYEISETIYTEGILHEHALVSAGTAPAKPATERASAKVAAGKAVAGGGKALGKATTTARATPKKKAEATPDAPPKRTTRRRTSS